MKIKSSVITYTMFVCNSPCLKPKAAFLPFYFYFILYFCKWQSEFNISCTNLSFSESLYPSLSFWIHPSCRHHILHCPKCSPTSFLLIPFLDYASDYCHLFLCKQMKPLTNHSCVHCWKFYHQSAIVFFAKWYLPWARC